MLKRYGMIRQREERKEGRAEDKIGNEIKEKGNWRLKKVSNSRNGKNGQDKRRTIRIKESTEMKGRE